MDDLELITPEHRQFCISEFKKVPSLRPPKKKEINSNDQKQKERDSAVLVPICRLPDESISLLYTKRSPHLRYVRSNLVIILTSIVFYKQII